MYVHVVQCLLMMLCWFTHAASGTASTPKKWGGRGQMITKF